MGQVSSNKAVESSLIGKAAPDIVLMKSDGSTSSVIGARQGGKAIIVFWATWCPNCYEEMGTLYPNWKTIEQKGIKIILVDVGEGKDDVQKYFKQRQMNLISFLDIDTSMQGPYHLVGIPTLIFIDDKGIVRSVTHEFPEDYTNYFGNQ